MNALLKLAEEARPEGLQPHSVAEAYFTDWAGKFAIPTVLMTLDQKILWANRAALDMVERAEDFCVVNGVFTCADKSQASEFRAFVEKVTHRDAWVYQAAEDRHIIARAEALQPEGEPPGVALMLIAAQSEDRYVWADLIKAFGLTKSEAVVARRMVGGAGAEAIAETLGVSIETVRTHIRRLYAKLSINSREKLFAVISRFRIG
ncbi:helix-turn-helix transcriptional regulator [Brevundimonas lenta]|uniref:DNA-binding CsgD family transcriptional regulator n=1 Tax=Brevundimonas lenta TaxID=424796 RepID=A0A7W6JBZ6_9CAUL|nr:helix-turn-helix transcriptional regulator [Brevundimonas lenta]MBB4082319.1 DNA-binding CsgD family transcriptional regulator [Brevundimonas lenta]